MILSLRERPMRWQHLVTLVLNCAAPKAILRRLTHLFLRFGENSLGKISFYELYNILVRTAETR